MLSLVTACMNREAHLRASLPRWLALPDVAEIVIVDWSTREAITDLLRLDDRIRIVRVEGETRWMLPYAYNLGIAHAQGDVIFKCDADCLPTSTIAQLMPAPGRFYAGNWQNGRVAGKACVNGQCLFTKAQWEEVNGYCELLRRYGHDDTDFYNRLAAAGHARTEIDAAWLEFVAHTDEDRVANHELPQTKTAAEAFLQRQPGYHEMINMVILSMMPWGRWFNRATFATVHESDRHTIVKRDVTREIPISAPLFDLARGQAVRSLTGRLCAIPPARLNTMNEAACIAEITRMAQRQAATKSVTPRAA